MSYSYYRQITIDNTKVPSDLTDYPYLFNSTVATLKTVANGGEVHNAASGGASGALTVPADLVFSPNTDGSSRYDFEVEKYDATTGELIAHVRIPSVSSSVDTVFYLVYGDSGVITSQENVTGVWDANFKGIWHLGESSNPYLDSTSNNNDSTAGTYPAAASTGKINGAQDFEEGSSQYISIPHAASLNFTAGMTVESWVKIEELPGAADINVIAAKRVGHVAGDPCNFQLQSHGSLSGKFHVQAWVSAAWKTAQWDAVTPTAGIWYYVVVAFDGSNLKISVDGQAYALGSAFASLVANTASFEIGRAVNTYYFDGIIDEVRASSTARSADYIQTTYNNQSSPSTFYSVGDEQGLPLAIDAVLKETQTDSFTADARLFQLSFTADAVLKETQADSFTADAYLSESFTADAVLKETQSSSITADAVLKGEQSSSFTADGVLLETTSDTLTAEAILLQTQTGSLTADACLTSDAVSPRQYLFAQAGPVYLPVFPMQPISVSVTSDHTADYRSVIFCDATSGSLAVTLPAATDNLDKCYTIKHTSGSHSVVVQGAETIDDAASQTLSEYGILRVISDNSEWWTI